MRVVYQIVGVSGKMQIDIIGLYINLLKRGDKISYITCDDLAGHTIYMVWTKRHYFCLTAGKQ